MNKIKRFAVAGCVGLLVLGIASNSYADRRSYVWTYEYMTMPKGMAEVEYYLTAAEPDAGKSNINTWKHQLEIEYGITTRWDIAMYQVWTQKNTASSSTFGYDGFKIRTRYRIGEKGQFFLDPLLYFEYIRDDDLSKPHVGEVKLILAKDLGDFNVSYNQIVKRNLEEEGETNHEYAAGVNYRFSPFFALGVESKGSYSERKYSVGPTIAWSYKKIFVALGAVFGLNEKTDDVQTRMIVGMLF